MKAELNDGTLVTLAKGCNCCNHNEPHWVHMDKLWREHNRALLRDAETPEQRLYAAHGAAKEEEARLTAKLLDFERLGIVRLIPESTDNLSDLQRKGNELAWKEMLPVAQPVSPYVNVESEVRMKASEAL